MPRYSLRNQDKIEQAYDSSILKRITASLDKHFAESKEIKPETWEGEKFEIITIDDVGHSFNIIAFYIIKKTYDVYNLAFKEFIG